MTTSEKNLKSAEREKDIADIQEAATLAEVATQKILTAERLARQEGSAYSLARFAYQVHKSGLSTDKLFAEVRSKVERGERISKTQEADQERDLAWALGDIAVWQHLSDHEDDARITLGKISDSGIKASTYTRLARKLAERNMNGLAFTQRAEEEVDKITQTEERQREGGYLAHFWAEQGNRAEVERLVKKYHPDDPNEQEEDLVFLGTVLQDHGVKVDDIFPQAFKNEKHPIEGPYKENLLAGLVRAGHSNEAVVLLLEQPQGDTQELEEAWDIFSQAQVAGDVETAQSAWKVIASLAKVDPDQVRRVGVELAQRGDESNTQAMLTLLDKAEKELTPDTERQRLYIQKSKNVIRMNAALQFIQKKRTEGEKRALVSERFHQPIAAAVKDLLLQIPDAETQVDGLRFLAKRLAERGSNPNLFQIVDQIEELFQKNADIFYDSTILETYLELAEITAKHIATKDGDMGIPQTYLDKAVAYLKSVHNYPPAPTDYFAERLWVAETRVAVAAIQAARDRLSRGNKTRTKTSTQLNRLSIPADTRRLIESIRPE